MKTKIFMTLATLALAGCSGDKNATSMMQKDFQEKAGDRVYFAFDKSCINEDSKAILTAQSSWLKEHAAQKATVVGKCDERGTREYNIALGQRRAENAASILRSNGIGEDRLSVVSYGKDRPEVPNAKTCEEHQKNRVAVTEIAG